MCGEPLTFYKFNVAVSVLVSVYRPKQFYRCVSVFVYRWRRKVERYCSIVCCRIMASALCAVINIKNRSVCMYVCMCVCLCVCMMTLFCIPSCFQTRHRLPFIFGLYTKTLYLKLGDDMLHTQVERPYRSNG